MYQPKIVHMKINKDHIKLLIKKKSLKQKDVAIKIDVGPQDFNNWMFRGIFPHYNKLEKLAEILDADVSTLYFENNIGEPAGLYEHKMSFLPEELVPFYDIDPHQGLSSLWKDNSTIPPKDYAYIPGLTADFIFPYYGKGMDPQLENGDWIALRKVSDFSFFNYGNVHAVATKEQVIVRNLKKSSSEETILLCGHENQNDDIELPTRSIKAIFMVVSVIKRNLI